jgi:hypothetical protein
VALLGGCQADITGANGDSGAKDPTTTGPGTTTTTKPADVPEPGDWFAAVQDADCKVPGTLARTRIRRLSTAQWSNTVAQALTVTPSVASFPADVILFAVIGTELPASIVVNELTTVAAAFSMAQFITDATSITGPASALRVAAGMSANLVSALSGGPSAVRGPSRRRGWRARRRASRARWRSCRSRSGLSGAEASASHRRPRTPSEEYSAS